MANPFVNFLNGLVNGSGDMRSYQHASRVYVDGNYALTPKPGWIYYVVVNINPSVASAIGNSALSASFSAWFARNKGNIGLLAKMVDLPKITIDTETLNQYNRSTVIQKKIKYNPVSITFHDDHSNVTTDLWKYYFQYYYADTVDSGIGGAQTSITPKYTNTKNQNLMTYQYGLNNKQTVPFFLSIDIFQLYQKKFTYFKLVNPLIKEWSHDQLDQTQGGRLLSSKMTIEYETVFYDTNPNNFSDSNNPGFKFNRYDSTPSPLGLGGRGTSNILGQGGVLAGATDLFGSLTNLNTANPLDLLNTAIKGANLARNVGNISKAGVTAEGYSILNSVLGNISNSKSTIQNPNGTISAVPARDRIAQGIDSGITQVTAPAGVNLFNSAGDGLVNATKAIARKIGL